jgi:hypothetical protein
MNRFQSQVLICLLLTVMASARTGSAQTATDSFSLLHSPRKASIYSAILPGAGQAYNKKYWKIPVIYAGFGVLGYFVKTNNDEYKIYKEAYKFRLDGDETTTDQFVGIYADQDLVTLKNFYRRNRDLSIIGMSVLYILNIIDASVDAHLFHFNVSDDLSLQLEPSLQQGLNTTPSLALRMRF